jgi:flagellar biosynthesis protein FlhG
VADHDQARNLREAAARLGDPGETPPSLPALAVTGGKGGVGKTSIAVNLALLLARLGKRPLLVDFDLGLANADVMLGLEPRTTLYEVATNAARPDEAVLTGPEGIGFVPAASGRDELTRLTPIQLNRLLASLGRLADGYDLMVIDTPAGIGGEVLAALRASKVVLVVTTPEPTSLTDAYALIKVLEAAQPGKDLRVVVNQAANQSEGLETFARLRKVVNTYLQRDLTLSGVLPRDLAVGRAVRRRQPLALGPDGPALQALRAMALRLKEEAWK